MESGKIRLIEPKSDAKRADRKRDGSDEAADLRKSTYARLWAPIREALQVRMSVIL
jgi:hypothetical protein